MKRTLHYKGNGRKDPRLLTGAAVCAWSAAGLAWLAHVDHPGLAVPPAIAYLVAAVLGAAGLRLAELAFRPGSSGDALAAAMLGAMAMIAGWIAFGPGERLCRMGIGPEPPAAANGAPCRVPFGIGAAVVAGLSLYALARWTTRRRSTGDAA